MKIGICIPTIRKESILLFLEKWLPLWEKSKIDLKLFIHSDKQENIINSDEFKSSVNIVITSQSDIKNHFGEEHWIIPQNSAACRSFPIYLAYVDGCDYIITMDDDCLPLSKHSSTFLRSHIQAFTQSKWYKTVDGEYPRGIPYKNRGEIEVVLNHGLWTNVPDLDGPTSLVNYRHKRIIKLKNKTEIIPRGIYFPMCAMNLCYKRKIIPISYNLLMGIEHYGIDRFDDIWSGMFIKKIADHLNMFVTNGPPFVNHCKASNSFANTKKEIEGMEIHESFWQFVDTIKFEKRDNSINNCFLKIASEIAKYQPLVSTVFVKPDYFKKLSEAMKIWNQKCQYYEKTS